MAFVLIATEGGSRRAGRNIPDNQLSRRGEDEKILFDYFERFPLSGFHRLGNPDAAEKFPVKPMEFIVPLEAGSDGDVIAARSCKRCPKSWGSRS